MKSRSIYTDTKQQELAEHLKDDFPLSVDRRHVAEKMDGSALHWHQEVQIAAVTNGAILFRAADREARIEKGQGVFINSGCPHEAVPTEDSDGEYVCVNFDPKIIAGYNSSLIRKDYIAPLLSADRLKMVFLNSESWHGEVCALLLKMAEVKESSVYAYEFELKILLSRIWLIIIRNNKEILEAALHTRFSDKKRMNTLQEYIAANYMEKITLKDIAGADHISKGECCRIFSRMLETTPFRYLVCFRISKSLKLLTSTDMSISEIAQHTGFGNSSYFTVCFKKEMGLTPNEYRKQKEKKLPSCDCGDNMSPLI